MSWVSRTNTVNRQPNANRNLVGQRGIWSDPMNSPLLKVEKARMVVCHVSKLNRDAEIISVTAFARPWARVESLSVNRPNRICSPISVTEGKARDTTAPRSMLLISIVSKSEVFSTYLEITSRDMMSVMAMMAIPLKKWSFWLTARITQSISSPPS
jgi:hypothetical protein